MDNSRSLGFERFEKNRKTENYILLFLLIISSSASTSNLSRSLLFITLSFFYSVFIFIKRKHRFNERIIYIFLFLVCFYFVYLFKFNSFNPKFTYRLVLYLLFAYVVVRILRQDFIKYFSKLIYILALLSLPLYLLQLFLFDQLYAVIVFIQNSIPFLEKEVIQSANIIVWSIQPKGGEIRNCGFMWEPGAFAAMLLLPIVFEFVVNRFLISKKIIIMTIAVLTTLSTMGYIGLVVIAIWYAYNKKSKYVFAAIPIIIFAAFYIFQLPFMKDKIIEEYVKRENTIEIAQASSYAYASYGRIGSAIQDYKDWKMHRLFGIGGQYEEMSYYGANGGRWVNRTNGLSHYLLTFGLVGFVLLILNLYFSFRKCFTFYNVRGVAFVVLIVMILSFSNRILITPLFFVFQIFYLADSKYNKQITYAI